MSSNFTPVVEKLKLILPTANENQRGEGATVPAHVLYRFLSCHKAGPTSVHLHLLVSIASSQHWVSLTKTRQAPKSRLSMPLSISFLHGPDTFSRLYYHHVWDKLFSQRSCPEVTRRAAPMGPAAPMGLDWRAAGASQGCSDLPASLGNSWSVGFRQINLLTSQIVLLILAFVVGACDGNWFFEENRT